MRGGEMHRERAWLFRKWYEFDVRYPFLGLFVLPLFMRMSKHFQEFMFPGNLKYHEPRLHTAFNPGAKIRAVKILAVSCSPLAEFEPLCVSQVCVAVKTAIDNTKPQKGTPGRNQSALVHALKARREAFLGICHWNVSPNPIVH